MIAWHIHKPFHVFHTVIETQLSANQSSCFRNVIYKYKWLIVLDYMTYIVYTERWTKNNVYWGMEKNVQNDKCLECMH